MGQCCANKFDLKREHERNIIKDLEIMRKEKLEIITKFIKKNIDKIKIKKNFESKINLLKSLFANQISDQGYNEANNYKDKFSSKLKGIIEQKESFFNELFPDDIYSKLENPFDYLKEKLGNYYNDDIYENKINFYKNFAVTLQQSEKFAKPYIKKSARKSLNTNFLNFISKNSKEKELQTSKNLNPNYSGFGALNFGDINLDKEQKYIKKDIDVLYKYCFNIEKLPPFDICKKRSKLLNLISDDNQNKDINTKISAEFINFLKKLYYIILLKKCNCLSHTGKDVFYCINQKRMTSISKEDLNEDLLMKFIAKDIKKRNNRNLHAKFSFHISEVKSRNQAESTTTFDKSSMRTTNLITESSKDENNNRNYILRKKLLNSNIINNINNINKNIITTNNNNNKQISEEKFVRRKIDSKKIKTVKEREPITVFKNINTLESNSKNLKFKQSSNSDEEYYSGQYDITTCLYAGFGILVEPDKNMCYTGTFRYGAKDGIGILYEEPSNNMLIFFIGEFRNNKIEGYGEKINLKSNIFFYREGLFNDQSFLQGKVKIIRENLLKKEIDVINYDGDMSKDLFHGYGHLIQKTYTINESKKYDFLYEKEYKGHYKNGKENGKGILRYDNGINESYQYSGNFVDGLKDGFGVINFSENFFIQKYEGFFKKDKPFCTYGIAYFKSGDKYEGFFNKSYQKDYVGQYLFYEPVSKIFNECYFGGFLNDAKQGLGKIYSKNNDGAKMLVGNFYMGDKQGDFEMNEYKNELVKLKLNNQKRKRLSSWNLGELYENKLQKNQKKYYILFDGNEIMEKSDVPIDA